MGSLECAEISVEEPLYANDLMGFTIQQARMFIIDNVVYKDTNNRKDRILEIREPTFFMLCEMTHKFNRLNVETKDNIITKIVNMG